MKTIKTSLVLSLYLVAFSSVAAQGLHDKLIIEAIPASEGTVVIEGKYKYEKSFNLAVSSKATAPIELTGFVGCYRAFDENGRGFDEHIVQLDLLGILKEGESKEGKVTFVSDDNSVYKAKFVKWSSLCPHIAKRS